MTQEELSSLQQYLDIKVKNGTIKRMHADDIYSLMKAHCLEPPVNEEYNDWVNDLTCNVDECCAINDEGLSVSQFMWVEESLARDLKSIWNHEIFNQNAIIDKACEWLRENIDKYLYNRGGDEEYIPTCGDTLFNDFREAIGGNDGQD